jgi:ATP-dependent DNA ligase
VTGSIAVTFEAFDVLHADGHDLMCSPNESRRSVLESLALDDGHCLTTDTFEDGHGFPGGV